MKKIIISLFALGMIFMPSQQSEAQFFKDLGDSFLSGIGVGVDDNNDGTQNIEDSINNWAGGIGQDILTDTFGNTGVGPIPDGQFALPCPEAFNGIANTTSLRQYVLNIVQWILSFLGLLAILMIIYAGFLYVTDGGDEDNVGKAKKIMLYSVIGILIIFAAYPLVNTVIGVASTGEDIDGAIAGSGGTTYITGSPDSQLSLEQQCQNQQFANSRPWFAWDWQDSNIDAIRNDIVVVPKGAPVKFKLKKSDLGSGKYTPEIKFVYWNFGDGNDWTVSSPKDSLEISKTYFEKGKYYASAVVEDKQGARHKLISQVIVGHVIEAKFSASTYFPASGQQVEFDASPTIAHFGDISEYEWETQEIGGTGTCPDMPDNTPRPSAKFFGEDLECRVSLKVYSDAKGANGENLTSSTYEEIIEVSLDPENNPDGAVPIPELNYIEVITDSSVTGADNLVLVKIEAWDQIDKPLENFKFEVFEDGQLVSFQASNYGVLVESGDPRPSGASAVPHDMHATYSEHLFDLSAFKGTHNYKFRVTVTNSFGKKDRIDSDFHEVIVANGNIPPQGKAEVSPAIGTTQTEFVFNGEVTDADLSDDLFYRWVFPDGTKTAKTAVPGGNKIPDLTHTFETSGTKAMNLWFTDGVVEREVIKNVFVGNGVINSGPQVSGIDVLPSRNAPIGTIFSFYPRLFDVNGDSLDYEWNFNEEAQLDTLNAAHKFNTEGQKRVIFTVSDGEKETVQEIVVNVYDPNKKNDDIERASFPRILRVVAEPDVERVGTAMEFFAEVEDDDSAERDLKYKWEFGDNTRSSSEVSPTHSYTKKGFYVVNLTVTDKEGHESKSSIKVEVIGEDEDMPNRLPIIKTFNVLPKTYGKIDDSFTFYVKSYDPDESDGDFVEYSWYLNGVLLNGKNGKQIVLKNDSNSRDPQFIDGENIVKIVAKDQRDGLAEAEKTIFISPDGTVENLEQKNVVKISRVILNPDAGKAGKDGENKCNTEFNFSLEFVDSDGVVLSSSDTREFEYKWNLGDGSALQTTEAVSGYCYAKKGNYRANVSVDISSDSKDSREFLVEVVGPDETMPNASPVIESVNVFPNLYGKPGETFEITVNAFDPNEADVLTYSWAVDGQTVEKNTNREEFIFEKSDRSYRKVAVTISDGEKSETIEKNFFITESGQQRKPDSRNAVPVIKRIIKEPGVIARVIDEGEKNKFIFTAEVEDDASDVLSYEWDFGDFSTATTSVATHSYEKPGNYVVRLSVTDTADHIVSTSFEIQVVGEHANLPNRVPIIKNINVLPKSFGKPNEPFTFVVDGFDPDKNDTIEFVWKHEGVTETGKTVSFTFVKEGYQTVVLEAKDSFGLTSTLEKTVYINKNGESSPSSTPERNTPPKIRHITNYPGGSVRLGEVSEFSPVVEDEDITTSKDDLKYKWDFGDGNTSSEKNVAHTFESAGTYLVKLKVTDSSDSVAEKFVSVRVFGPNETMPNRAPVISNVSILPKSYGKINENFTLKTVVRDPESDAITVEWKTIDDVLGTGNSIQTSFEENGLYQIYIEATDETNVASRMVTININPEGEKIETLDWDTQYLKWLEQVNHWKEEQAKLAAEKQRLLDRIANESNEEKRKELAKELAKVNDLLANAGENLKQAEQELNKLGNNDDSAENDAVADKQKTAKLVEKIQLELAAKKKALLEAIANEPNAEKRKILEAQLKNIEALIDQAETTLLSELQGAGETGAIKRQIALLDNLIVDSENTLELLDFDVKTLQQDRAALLKKIAETDDPVERSKLLQTLFALDAEIAQIQQKQVFEASRLEKLKQEKSFLEKSLKSEDLGSRVEKQRDVQRIRRIIKQLFIRIKEVQNVLHELNSTQTEALRDFSTGSTLEDRTEKLPAIESRDKKILGKQKELLALEKTVAGMETQKQQKETQLYVSSVKTESAVQAKIETLQSDVRRIRQSLKAFYENLSIEQQENADLEQKLVLANSQTLRDSLRNEVQAVLNKIASIQAGIFEQESRIIYYEQNVANLEGQLLEIVGSGYEIGIKNKEELQLKLENTESQIAEAKALVIKTKEARVALAKKRDGLLGNLESEVNEAQKSAILEEVKTLDLELFALDKKLVPQENKLASLTRNVQSLKQDLFGSVNAFDLQSDIKNIVARKDFAKELADKFTKRITDQNQEKQALVAKISELGNADVMAVLFRELDNLAIYKQNIHQFELVFELGEVIQLESFVDTKVDLAEAKKAIATDEAEVLSKIFTQAVSADLKDEYVSIRTNLQDLHEKLREQVDLADLLEMKQALLEATIENDKVIFEQTLADTYKSVAAKKDEIDAAFSDRLELESDWREGRNKVVVIPKDRAKNVQKIEAIDESIVQKDLAIETLKADIFTRIVKIDAYSELLEKYFVIQGTTETKFFLYGRLPKDTTKALFVEWDTGDGRILYGQNINVQYAEPGKYSVKMNVTDGVNTSTDVLTIKVDSAS